MNFSVCIDAVYHGKDLEASLRECSGAGFRNIEFWSWWDKDVSLLETLQRELGIRYVAFCAPFVSLVDAARRTEFLRGLSDTIAVAKRLHCQRIIAQTGNELSLPRAAQHEALVEGLRTCVGPLEKSGVTLVIEPLNLAVDHPGYYLASSREAFAVAQEVHSDHVKVLYDIYHMQINEGDILRAMEPNLGKIGHIHVAGSNGRHEPENGELNYPFILNGLDAAGYGAYIGLEYYPLGDPLSGLKAFAESCEGMSSGR